MNWVKALAQDKLPAGEREVVQLAGKAVLLINHQDEIHAVDNACPHLRLPLKGGKISDDCAIICPFHRSAFDLRTGDVKEWSPWPPGVGRILGAVKSEQVLPVYKTRIEDGQIFVGFE